MRYPANHVSSMHLVRVQASETVAAGNESAALVQEIEEHVAAGQAHQAKAHYRPAIEEYKTAMALAYRLLHPGFDLAAFLRDDRMRLPTGPDVEVKLALAGLRLAEAIQPDVSQLLPPVRVEGFRPPSDLVRFDQLGIRAGAKLPTEIRVDVRAGLGMLEKGRPDRALETFSAALAELGPPTAAKAANAGAIALNLSSAHLALGNKADADLMASLAGAYFLAAGDRLGQEQAEHNRAIARDGAQAPAFSVRAAASDARTDAGAPEGPARIFATRPTERPAPAERPAADGATGASPSGASLLLERASLLAPAVAVRWPEEEAGRERAATIPLKPTATAHAWTLSVETAADVQALSWDARARPDANVLLRAVYEPRVGAKGIRDLAWRGGRPSGTAAYLTHLYSFVLPQALGDCYHAMGDFERAESYYLQAAGYTYLNRALEAPGLWSRLADNLVAWGDSLYKQEKMQDAMGVYARLILSTGAPPADSPLYTLPGLAGPAAEARTFIASLAADAPAEVNPALALPITLAWSRWQLLLAGLDFFGTSLTPLFTFEYLQQVARAFAQQAIQAEREYVTFQVHAEAEAATRRELEGAIALAHVEAETRREMLASSVHETRAYEQGVALASLRVDQARSERNGYAHAGYWQYKAQSIAAAHGARVSWFESEIRGLANAMEAGSWGGDYGKLTAAATLLAGQKSYEYQLQRLQNDIAEMEAMVPLAQSQLASARARQRASQLSWQAARMRESLTRDALEAFNEEVFTPELWTRMAQAMLAISRSYQEMAVRVARLMERAYNFETDRDVRIIKSDYPTAATGGLLGADHLLKDVESFTHHHIAHTRGKETYVKDVVSLANEYPFQFAQLLRTGDASFETMLRDFEDRHPGLHGHRLRAVEIEVVGLLPPEGIRGVLRSGAWSRYRSEDGSERLRFHATDALALSDYVMRNDAFVYRQDPRMHGLFEGHGVAGSWRLELPRRSNNLDYRLISDVRLVFYYSARYSPALAEHVATRPPLPGERTHVRTLLTRYDFPEAWYGLLDAGETSFDVTPHHMPRNETAFRVERLAVRLLTAEGTPASNVALVLTLPGRAPVRATTDSEGEIAATPGSPLAAAMGGDLLGRWTIRVDPPAGHALRDADGKLLGDRIEQVALILEYGFDWPA